MFEQAAAEGTEEAAFNLGWMYWEGKGVEKDYGQSVYWHKKAALHGDRYSMLYLGLAYLQGLGVEKDENRAKQWMMESAGLNLGSAELLLAYLSLKEGESADHRAEAQRLCVQAANDKSREIIWVKRDFEDAPKDFASVMRRQADWMEGGEAKEYLDQLLKAIDREK